MAKTAYERTSLTGGGAYALDGIDGAGLLDGDFAFVFVSGTLYHYILDDDLNTAENEPNIIVPNDNPGTLGWKLQGFYGGAEKVNAIGGTGGGTQDIDLSLGFIVSATVDTSANTFTFSKPSLTGTACAFTLILTNGGSQTVTWPGAVDWVAGTAPILTAAGVDVLAFLTRDAGTIWLGFVVGLDVKSP